MEKRVVTILYIVSLFFSLHFGIACDDDDDSTSSGQSTTDDDDDNDDTIDHDDDTTADDDDETTPLEEDDDTTTADDDDTTADDDDVENADPIRYLYGGIVADQEDRTLPHSGKFIALAIAPTGDRWAVGIKARRLLLFHETPAGDVTTETIAPFAGNPDLALGSDGLPRLVYIDLADDKLIYAEPAARGWTFSTVAQEIAYDSPTRLAIDGDGRPHLLWYHLAEKDDRLLRYAQRSDGAWAIVDPGLDDYFADLVVTDDGQPIIVSTYNQILHVTQLTDEGWQTASLTGDKDITDHPSAALDPDGRLHIICGFNGVGLRYVVLQNGQWSVEEVDSGFKGLSLALDDARRPHASAVHYGGYLIYSSRSDAGVWTNETVDDVEQAGDRTSLALAPDGTVNILRTRTEHALFGIWRKDGNAWSFDDLDTGAAVGEFPVLRLDSTGTAHLLFTNDTEKEAIYAVSDADGSHWTFETLTLDTCSPAVGLAIATDDQPWAALHSKEKDRILYGTKTAAGWQFETVDAGSPSSVAYLTLELDSTDTPHLAYFDNVSETLRYITRTADGWQATTIDNSFEWSWGVSLAVDPDGHAHITAELWGETIWCSLRYASNALGDWINIALDPLGSCAAGESIVIASDAVQILYGDMVSSSLLRHAWYTDHQWNIEQTALWGGMPSLSLDDAEELHAATVGAESGLYYARHGETGWTQRPLDEIGAFYPFNPSLAVDANGMGHVAYTLNQALWYARFSVDDEK